MGGNVVARAAEIPANASGGVGKGPASNISPPQASPFPLDAIASAVNRIPTTIGQVPQAPTPQAPPPSPLTQQIMAQRTNPQFSMPQMQVNPQISGLPMALALLRGQFNQMMAPRAPQQFMPIPQYGRPAQMNPLAYSPIMVPAQQSLGRVAVGVAEQQRRAAQAELDRMRAEEASRQSEAESHYQQHNMWGG